MPWPSVRRVVFGRKVILFTDGSCLFPSRACIRLAAGAVVTPVAADKHDTVWSGQIPTSCQSIPRAEVLAGAVAVAAADNPVVISDSLYFVRNARTPIVTVKF